MPTPPIRRQTPPSSRIGFHTSVEIHPARPEEVEELLPLMRAYCEFYEASPPDGGLREMARALISEPEQGGLLIALVGEQAVGFAALCWKWSSLRGARIGVMEDLFVAPDARGGGIADALIEACADLCRDRGAPAMEWLTAPDNHRAQAVYDRAGGQGRNFVAYELEL
jgi:GNAT superfamily N-acetyltransferase